MKLCQDVSQLLISHTIGLSWVREVSGGSPESREACGRHGVLLVGGIPHSIATPARDLQQHTFSPATVY
jgi:hypothetical protein